MRKLIFMLVLAMILAAPVAAQVVPDSDARLLNPLPIRGEFLLSGGYLALTPSSTELIADDQWAFELRLTTANTFALSNEISEELITRNEPSAWHLDRLRQHSRNVFVVDGEIQRATLTIRRKVGSAEVFAAVPVLSSNTAWADKIIENFHADFRLGSDGRSAILRDRQFIYLKSGDRELVRTGPGEAGFGDVTLGAKYALPPIRKAALAAEVLVELPSGDAEMLFGSGSIDAAFNLLASRRIDRSTVFASTGVTRLGRNTVLGIPDRTIVTTTFGYSRVITADTSATIQLTTADSPFRGLDWPELGERFYQYALGIQHQVDEGKVLHLALIENAVHYENSADFALQVGLSVLRP